LLFSFFYYQLKQKKLLEKVTKNSGLCIFLPGVCELPTALRRANQNCSETNIMSTTFLKKETPDTFEKQFAQTCNYVLRFFQIGHFSTAYYPCSALIFKCLAMRCGNPSPANLYEDKICSHRIVKIRDW